MAIFVSTTYNFIGPTEISEILVSPTLIGWNFGGPHVDWGEILVELVQIGEILVGPT